MVGSGVLWFVSQLGHMPGLQLHPQWEGCAGGTNLSIHLFSLKSVKIYLKKNNLDMPNLKNMCIPLHLSRKLLAMPSIYQGKRPGEAAGKEGPMGSRKGK